MARGELVSDGPLVLAIVFANQTGGPHQEGGCWIGFPFATCPAEPYHPHCCSAELSNRIESFLAAPSAHDDELDQRLLNPNGRRAERRQRGRCNSAIALRCPTRSKRTPESALLPEADPARRSGPDRCAGSPMPPVRIDANLAAGGLLFALRAKSPAV